MLRLSCATSGVHARLCGGLLACCPSKNEKASVLYSTGTSFRRQIDIRKSRLLIHITITRIMLLVQTSPEYGPPLPVRPR